VFAHIAKGDGSQAVAALERAREAITRLPPGEVLAHEQAHLENDMMDIQEKIGRLEAVGRKQLEDECVRLEGDLELRLEKTRSFLEARGERKDSMSKELRQKRHELESENLLLLKEFARENSLKLGKLRKVYTEIGSLDLGKRLAQVILLKQSEGSQLMFSS
jgi:ABC-type phosphate transport system auxiliary subunit